MSFKKKIDSNRPKMSLSKMFKDMHGHRSIHKWDLCSIEKKTFKTPSRIDARQLTQKNILVFTNPNQLLCLVDQHNPLTPLSIEKLKQGIHSNPTWK